MNTSNVGWVKRETIPFNVIEEKMPANIVEILRNINIVNPYELHNSSLSDQYFNAEPVSIFTDEEKEKLSEQLGESLIRNNYTTEELRCFLDNNRNNYNCEEKCELQEEDCEIVFGKRKQNE